MSEEIKEYPKEQQKLKDYLDNVTVEQIIEKLKDNDGMTWWVDYQDKYQPCFKKVYDKEIILLLDCITNLQQENKRLKNRWRKYNQKIEDYKSKNEKAIENLHRNYWIKEHEHNDDIIDMTLNILQGSDKE